MKTNKVNTALILEKWTPFIKQVTKNAINESTADKLEWMCQYAHNHSQFLNEDAQGGVSFPYQTLNNTVGVGNPVPASMAGQTGPDQSSPRSFGSGDKWTALLPMSLQVAARTIGFDLVNTTPFAGPTGVIPFMDYVYAGSKQPFGATPAYDTASANPRYNAKHSSSTDYAFLGYELPAAFRATLDASTFGTKKAALAALAGATKIVLANDTSLAVQYIGSSRLNASPMFKVLADDVSTTATSLGEIFEDGAVSVTIDSSVLTLDKPRLISMLEDQVLGYAGAGALDTDKWTGTFVNGSVLYDPMNRATGEQQYPRQLALQLFTKFVSVGTIQVAVGVTQEDVTDLQKQWGIDVMKMVQNSAVNELSQTMNKHILSRLFALGWQNHIEAEQAEGINLNLTIDPDSSVDSSTSAYAWYSDGATHTTSMTVPAFTSFGNFENVDTVMKRIQRNILAAGNVIMNRGRRGAANFVVMNAQMATALQANAQYSFSPIANTLNQSTGQLYPTGTIAGMTVYVDPNMAWSDKRVLVGRKGAQDEPGVHFCPYVMAESINMIAEGTGAAKAIVKSRYALVDVGFYPWTQYLTLYVAGDLF